MKIIIGAAVPQEGWVETTIETLNILKERDWQRYSDIEAVFAEHVWEHLTPPDALRAAQLCYKYLTPGGYIRVAVPDGLHPDPAYIEFVRPGGRGPGCDDHQVLYHYASLAQVFLLAGFSVRLLEYWDGTGRFRMPVKWDPSDGLVRRSYEYDQRNSNRDVRPCYTSIILDAYKPKGVSPWQ